MNIPSFLLDGLRFINNGANNVQVKLINYSNTDSDYDDVITQTAIGSAYTSGLLFPVNGKQGSEEAMLMEQGKLLTQDKVLYLGSISMNTSGLLIGIGSPTPSEYYSVLDFGIKDYNINGSLIYRKLMLRYTIPGSLF